MSTCMPFQVTIICECHWTVLASEFLLIVVSHVLSIISALDIVETKVINASNLIGKDSLIGEKVYRTVK